MKSLAMSLAAFGALGCSLALADPAPSSGPGAGGAVVLSGAELDAVRGGANRDSKYRLRSKSVDYYTETREEYDPVTETWNTVQGDTYKVATRSSYLDTQKGPRTSYSTTTRVVRRR